MSNSDVARIFDELADMEEIEGNRWESLAYRKAAASIRALGLPLETIYSRGELRTIDGVGSAIEKKIIQFLETGEISKYSEMKSRYPIDFTGLRRVQGLGPKKIRATSELDMHKHKFQVNKFSMNGINDCGCSLKEEIWIMPGVPA